MKTRMLTLVLFVLIAFSCKQDPAEALIPLEARMGASPASEKPSGKAPDAGTIVFKSTDGGVSWEDAGAGLPAGMSARNLVVSGGDVYLNAENGLFRTNPAAPAPLIWESQTMLPDNFMNLFPGKNGVYGYGFERGLFQNVPGTEVWRSGFESLKNKSVYALLETADGALFSGGESGILKSTDGGKNWREVFSIKIVTQIVELDKQLFAASCKGLFRSSDGGEHWESLHVGENNGVSRICTFNGGIAAILYQVDSKGNLAMNTWKTSVVFSRDGGNAWQDITETLPHAKNYHNLVQAGDKMLCCLDTGVFRSTDGGKSWTLVLPVSDGKQPVVAVLGNTVYAIMFFGC